MAAFTPLGSSLVGTDADDSLLVAAGDPTISLTTAILARDGNDSLAIDAPLNATLINLNKGDDSLALSATATASSIFGGGGNDILSLAALLSSEIRGGGGNDRITLTGSISGASLINGNLGDDLISASLVTNAVALSAGAGNDTLLGSAFNDTLTAGAGSDSVLAADGDDLLLLGTLDPGEVINGGNGTNTLRWSSDAGIDFSIASLSAIQQLELAPGGSGDTYTIAQGLSSGSPLLITGGGIATGEADQLRIRQAASSGAFSLAQSAGGDLLTYTDAITGSPVTITFANSSGGSVRNEGGDLLYTSSTGGGGGDTNGLILMSEDYGKIAGDFFYDANSYVVSQAQSSRLRGTEFEFSQDLMIVTSVFEEEDGSSSYRRIAYYGSFAIEGREVIAARVDSIGVYRYEQSGRIFEDVEITIFNPSRTVEDIRIAGALNEAVGNADAPKSLLAFKLGGQETNEIGDFDDIFAFGGGKVFQPGWWSNPFEPNLI